MSLRFRGDFVQFLIPTNSFWTAFWPIFEPEIQRWFCSVLVRNQFTLTLIGTEMSQKPFLTFIGNRCFSPLTTKSWGFFLANFWVWDFEVILFSFWSPTNSLWTAFRPIFESEIQRWFCSVFGPQLINFDTYRYRDVTKTVFDIYR